MSVSSVSEQNKLELATESRQTHLKIFIRVVAIVDMVHIVFPICLFGNLAITAAFTWIGPHTDERQRSLIYFAPVGVVAIVILTYGIIISIRLFNCSEPDMRPSKSAKMALSWWHYTLFLLVVEVIASGYYFFVSNEADILGYLFSFLLNFSIAIKTISLYLVRTFITEMRNIEIRVAPAESRTIVRRTPLFLQKQHQMRLLTKAVVIVDLIQNGFMLLSIVYACVQNAVLLSKMPAEKLGYGIPVVIYVLIIIGVYYYALQIGLKLFKATDKIVDVKHLQEMSPEIQLRYNKIFRNWLIVSLGCILLVEFDCLLLAIFRGNLISVFYIGALSFSFGIRAVSIYFVRRFKKDFWKKREEGASDTQISMDSIDFGVEESRQTRQSVVNFNEAPQVSESKSSQISEPSATESVSSQKTEPVGILTSSAKKSQPVLLPQSDPPKSSEPVPPPPQESIQSQPQPPQLPSPTQYFRSLLEQSDSESSFLWKATEN